MKRIQIALFVLGTIMLWIWNEAAEQPILLHVEDTSENIPWSKFQALTSFDHQISKASILKWLPQVDPHDQLKNHLSIQENRLIIFKHASRINEQIIIHFKDKDKDKDKERRHVSITDGTPLQGLRVLVDPGHFGGSWSQVEKRHFAYPNQPIIKEGNLTFATALVVARNLRALGADVFLSRALPPTQLYAPEDVPNFHIKYESAKVMASRKLPIESDLQAWRARFPEKEAVEQLHQALFDQNFRAPFHLFSLYDLRRRAAEARLCDVHLTISIHFNASENPDINHTMVFIPGHFMRGELDTQEERFYAIHRLLEDSLEPTATFATTLAKNMEQYLELEPLRTGYSPSRHKLAGTNSAYLRNLAILKRTQGPVVLLEGPFMTHQAEHEKLHANLKERKLPNRIRPLANAIQDAVLTHRNELKAWRENQPDSTRDNQSDCPSRHIDAITAQPMDAFHPRRATFDPRMPQAQNQHRIEKKETTKPKR